MLFFIFQQFNQLVVIFGKGSLPTPSLAEYKTIVNVLVGCFKNTN